MEPNRLSYLCATEFVRLNLFQEIPPSPEESAREVRKQVNCMPIIGKWWLRIGDLCSLPYGRSFYIKIHYIPATIITITVTLYIAATTTITVPVPVVCQCQCQTIAIAISSTVCMLITCTCTCHFHLHYITLHLHYICITCTLHFFTACTLYLPYIYS